MWEGLSRIRVSDISVIVLGSTNSGWQQNIAKASHLLISKKQKERSLKEPWSAPARRDMLQCPISSSQTSSHPFHHLSIMPPCYESIKRLSVVMMSELSRSHPLPKAHHLATQTPTCEPGKHVLSKPQWEYCELSTPSASALSGVQMSLGVKLQPGKTNGTKGPLSKQKPSLPS